MDSGASRLRTRANALTALRLVAGPLLVLALVRDAAVPAFVLFWLAVGSDLLDGRVARRYGEASPLGGFLDHVTDAAFVSLGLAALVVRGEAPALLPALGRNALVASALGRWNGIAYFVPIGTVVVRDALGLPWPGNALVLALGWALVASTVLSMADRLWALRRALRSR